MTTPESALHALEDAYRQRDREAAALCRDSYQEARLMLRNLAIKAKESADYLNDESIIRQTAEVLQAAWRSEELPAFEGVTTRVVSVEHYWDCFHVATQEVRPLGRRPFQQRMILAHADGHWAVMCSASVYEKETKRPWWKLW